MIRCQVFELGAPDLDALFGPRDQHPLWLYCPQVDPEAHHEFWSDWSVKVYWVE